MLKACQFGLKMVAQQLFPSFGRKKRSKPHEGGKSTPESQSDIMNDRFSVHFKPSLSNIAVSLDNCPLPFMEDLNMPQSVWVQDDSRGENAICRTVLLMRRTMPTHRFRVEGHPLFKPGAVFQHPTILRPR
jgi:hypothetical protein